MAHEQSLDVSAAPAAMSWADHARATLVLGLPLIGSQLTQMVINTTDVIMLGRVGALELGSAVLGTQAFFVTYLFGSGFAAAVIPLAANAHGGDDPTGVRRSVRMGLWVLALYTSLSVIWLWQGEAIFILLGQEPAIAALSGSYLRILQWGMFPALLTLGLRSFFTAIGRTQIILWAGLAAAALNAVLDYVLIFGNFGAPQLGIQGAAIASLFTNTLMFSVVALYVLRKDFRAYELFVRLWRPDWPVFSRVARLGLPISLTIIAEAGLFMAASIMMGWLGANTLAAHGIALQLASIVFMFPLGLSYAASARAGQAVGRRDMVGLGRAAKTALFIGVGFSFCGAMLFWLIPEPLSGLFLDRDNPNAAEVLAIAVPLLSVAAAFQVVDSIQVITAGLLRGIQDTRVPMLIAIFSYWAIGMPIAYLAGFVFEVGGPGIWSGLAFGLACAAAMMTWRFSRRETLGLV